jgi:endonuclease/exonuclease/phosphatase family metal-dependent hydrolase
VRYLVLLAACATGLWAADAVRIVSWNVNKGRNPQKIAEALRRFAPDICLLQEIDRGARRTGGLDVTAEIARLLNMHAEFAPAFEELSHTLDGRPAHIGQGIVSRWPIRASRILAFQAQSGFWKPNRILPTGWGIMQRRNGGRVAQIVELDTPAGPLVIYNTHLESRTWGKIRRAQLDEMLADAQRYPATTTVVFAGDFNSQFDPTALLRRMTAAGFRNSYGDRKQRTHRLFGSVDWIFVRGPLTVREGRVHRGIGVSDHFPLSVQLVPAESAP